MTQDGLARHYQTLAETYAKLAEELKKPPAPEGEPVNRLRTIRWAAQRLGCSETYLYRHASELPFMRKHGSRWRVSEAAVDAYVRSMGQPSDAA